MPWVAPEKASKARATDFPGLASRIDPDDLPDGAAREQVNLTSHRPGVLATRPGFLAVTFEED